MTTGSRTVLFPVTATTGAFFRALQKVHHPKNIAGTSDGTAAGHNSFQVTTQGYKQSHLLHLAIATQAVKPQQKRKGGGGEGNSTTEPRICLQGKRKKKSSRLDLQPARRN